MNDDVPKDPEAKTKPPIKKYHTITQKEFDQKLKLHHEWLKLNEENREKQKDKRLVLKKYDLSHLDLVGKKLWRVDFSFSKLSKPYPKRFDLSNADLMQAKLVGAHLEGVDFSFSKLDFADLRYSHLREAFFWVTKLKTAKFNFADLTRGKFRYVRFRSKSFDPINSTTESESQDSMEGGEVILNAQFRDVNMSEANCAEVDFMDTDLSRTNFRGAVLVKANLEKAYTDGTNFGGANVSNATMPSEHYFEDRIDTVNDSSRMLRTLFITLLGALAFCGLTILSTKDAQLLSYTASFELPIIGTRVSTKWFYFLAPWFLLGLFIYFHLYLIKHCWLLAQLPRILTDNTPIGAKVLPWALNSWATHYFENPKGSKESVQWSREVFGIILAWFSTPFCLMFFWEKSWVSHDIWLIEIHFWATLTGWALAVDYLRISKQTLSAGSWGLVKASPWEHGMNVLGFIGIIFVAIILNSSQYLVPGSVSRYLKELDISYQEVSIKPKNWNPKDPTAGVRGADLSGKDLSNAEASNVFLVNANLRDTNWYSADLREADFRGAQLFKAYLVNADLISAKFEEAQLTFTHLEGSNLVGADLSRAHLSGANLDGASLDRADLSNANMSFMKLIKAKNLKIEQVKKGQHWERAFYDNSFRKKLGITDALLLETLSDYGKYVAEYKEFISRNKDLMTRYKMKGVLDFFDEDTSIEVRELLKYYELDSMSKQ